MERVKERNYLQAILDRDGRCDKPNKIAKQRGNNILLAIDRYLAKASSMGVILLEAYEIVVGGQQFYGLAWRIYETWKDIDVIHT
jgi:hypothetical protein